MKEKNYKAKWQKLKTYILRKAQEDATVLAIIGRIPEYKETSKLMRKHWLDIDKMLAKMEEIDNEKEQ